MARGLAKQLTVRSDLAPGDGAVDTGERIVWGGKERIIYRLEEPETKVVPLIDPNTKDKLWKRGAGGVTLGTFHTTRVETGTRVREFILHEDGTGQTKRIFKGFRPDPEAIRREEERARIDAFQKELAEAATAEGISVSDLVKAVKGKAAKKDAA